MAGSAVKKGTVLLLKAPKDPSEEDHFVEALELAGYGAILVPVLAFNFINQKKLASALANAHNLSGIIFTSPRAVRAVSRVLEEQSDGRSQHVYNLRCFVVGQTTADAAKEARFHPEGMDTGNAEKLAQFILDSVSKEEKRPLLYPCAQMRRDTLLERLQSNECSVEEIVAYETVPSESVMEDLSRVFSCEDAPDSVVYFSPSGVQFTESAVEQGVLPLSLLKVYALGPSTQQAIVSRGYQLTGVAAKPDPAGLVQLLQKG